jgi:RNA polymerase II subunit A small phosphatase-like protein
LYSASIQLISSKSVAQMAHFSSYLIALLMAACPYKVDTGMFPILLVQESTLRLWAIVPLEAHHTYIMSVQATITSSADIPNSTTGGANLTVVYMCNVAHVQTATDLTTTAKVMEAITAAARE